MMNRKRSKRTVRKALKSSINRISPTSNHETSQLVFALLVALLGVVISYAISAATAQQSVRDQQAYTAQQVSAVHTYLATKLHSYEQLLHSSSALFSLKPELSRSEWQQYIEESRVLKDSPAILGLGYAKVLTKADIATHEQQMRQQPLYSDYTVHPIDERNDYTSVVYIEPSSQTNSKALGYDMYSDAVRRMAMEQARDGASAAMTAPVHLIQDEEDKSKTGVLIYYPLYQTGMSTLTVAERRAAITGYVYIVTRPSDIVTNTLTTAVDLQKMSFTLSDIDTQQVTYKQMQPRSGPTAVYEDVSQISLLGRNWQIRLVSYQSVLQRYTGPAIMFLLGVLVSIAVGTLIYTLLIVRLRRITNVMDEEVKRAKDDVLALTSHQLRTPASGVKQYLGMLTQGFMGKLTIDQQQLANKAYEANERQLDIIDQMLHVAKADAGKLKMNMTTVPIAPLVHEIVESLAADIKRKRITLALDLSEQAEVYGDPRYVRMIIENLISNAVKYSYQEGDVAVSVSRQRRLVDITVRDKGVGIAKDDIKKLFTKFGRIPNELSVKEGGSGLGLFLVNVLVSLHHGKLHVESEVGKGTTFVCTLPDTSTHHPGV